MNPLVLMLLTFFAALVVGVPVAFSLGLASVSYLLVTGRFAWALLSQRMFSIVDSFPLLAVPFFILAARLMEDSGILGSLLELSRALVGHIRGGLAHVNIVASMFFAGITGSPTADTAAIGSALIPAMVAEDYPLDFSAAVTVSSSTIGPIIPPSIPMVIYALVEGRTSLAALFLAGFVPGILVGFALMFVAWVICVRRGFGLTRSRRITLKELWPIMGRSFMALLMPIIILGGILTGIFTPTEASATAVGYAFIVGFFVTKRLKLDSLPDHFLSTAITTASVLFVLAASSVFGWILTVEQVPNRLARTFLEFSSDPAIFLLLVNLMLLIVGCFMNTTSAITILAPILSPIALSMGINPVHFGFVMVMNLILGQITPPVGSCLFVVCGISEVTMEEVSKAVLPFLAAEIVILFLVTYVPSICLFIPRMFGFV